MTTEQELKEIRRMVFVIMIIAIIFLIKSFLK